MKPLYHPFFVFFLLFATQVFAQQLGVNEEKYHIHIKRATSKITIDGHLDEDAWKDLEQATGFWQFFPYDSSQAKLQTQAMVAFDDNFIYVAAICKQKRSTYVVSSLKRDFGRGSSDIFGVNFDPFKDKLNGFSFAVSPLGVQREGLISNGNELNIDWDNKWYSAVSNDDDYFYVEIAIPFKTLRYRRREQNNEWHVNFFRNSLRQNESSSWTPIPRNFSPSALAFAGKLIWDEPPPQPGANVSIIPYSLVKSTRDLLNNESAKNSINFGGDAKVAVTPSLNLDITVNPDFAQVEVDQQQTNLSRFELFFPERRQFFLENNDLFGSFGTPSINPFFSRRIGLFRNPQTTLYQKTPILGGVRLSGRLDKNWRIGFLDMQTARTQFSDTIALPSTNYSMIAVQRRVFTRSSISAVMVNKDPFGIKKGDVSATYNRVAGLEYRLASKNNQLQGKLFYHRSFTPDQVKETYAFGGFLGYDRPTFNGNLFFSNIGDNFQVDVGYLPRKSLLRTGGQGNLVFYPKSGLLKRYINRFSFGPDWDFLYGKIQGRLVDWDAGIFGSITLQNQSQIDLMFWRYDYTYLYSAFDPTNTGGKVLPINTSYLYRTSRVTFTSNLRHPLFYTSNARFGQYFNGNIFQLQSTWSYRWQPYGIFSLDFNYTRIRLPQPYNNSDLLLIGPKFDFSFSRKLFLTTYIQYNNQINNINSNIRLQWRYRPVSDLYVVYTDNYFAYNNTEDNRNFSALQLKNRALVVKWTYWLNL